MSAPERPHWRQLPLSVRAVVESWLGAPVVRATSGAGGFSPGVAALVEAASGGCLFIKAACAESNPVTPEIHRREGRIAAALPSEAPAPALRHVLDQGGDGWVVLGYEAVGGAAPLIPWRGTELRRCLAALSEAAAALTPSPLPLALVGDLSTWYVLRRAWWAALAEAPPATLDEWSRRNAVACAALERTAVSAGAGETLLHLDLRSDNFLLTSDRVVLVDWAHAGIGAPWVDVAFMAPSVALEGGPSPEELLALAGLAGAAPAEGLRALVAGIAGFFTYQALLPAPPGLPTLRTFQAAQGRVARDWLRRLTGLR